MRDSSSRRCGKLIGDARCDHQGTSGIHPRFSHYFRFHFHGKTDTAACSEIIAHRRQPAGKGFPAAADQQLVVGQPRV